SRDRRSRWNSRSDSDCRVGRFGDFIRGDGEAARHDLRLAMRGKEQIDRESAREQAVQRQEQIQQTTLTHTSTVLPLKRKSHRFSIPFNRGLAAVWAFLTAYDGPLEGSRGYGRQMSCVTGSCANRIPPCGWRSRPETSGRPGR